VTAVAALAVCSLGTAAGAARKTVVVAAGDCGDPGLLGAARDFQELARTQVGADLLEAETVLRAVRPQASRGVPELERQVEAARALLYSGENERGLDMVQDARAELERASPLARPGPVLVQALLLEAQMLKNLDRWREFADAHRKVLKVEPRYAIDADQFPPSTLQAFEGVRRELAKGRRGTLLVEVLSGPSASVFIDGREVGTTGRGYDLPQGTYRVELVVGDRVSFAHKVALGRAERLQVDLDFEGSVAVRPPLCAGDDRGAQRLASSIAAQRVVVLRDGAGRGNPPYWLGTLYEVRTTERVRNGGVRADQLRDLMTYLFTGKPELPEERPLPTKVVVEAPPAPEPEAREPAAAEAPPERARRQPEPATVTPPARAEAPPPRSSLPGALAAPPPAPAVVAATEAPRPVSVARAISWTALGVGAALAATGVVLHATWGTTARDRLDFLRAHSAGGRLPDPATAPEAYAESLRVMSAVDTSTAVSLTLVGAGVGAAVGGLLGLVLFPPRTATVSLAPLVQGGLVAVQFEL